MIAPSNPGQKGYQRQPGQGGYQQPDQQGWMPSASSTVPAPGQDTYGQQPGQDACSQNPQGCVQPGADAHGCSQQVFPQFERGGGFIAVSSMSFQNKGGVALTKVAQLTSLIVRTGFALYGPFEFLMAATSRGGALQILTYLAKAIAYITFGFFLPAFNRAVLERAVDDEEQRILRIDSAFRKDYRLIVFDLGSMLTPSKSPLPNQMAATLHRPLDLVGVCVISGDQFGQFSSQLLDNLGASTEQLGRLHLMPTCGTCYMRYIDGQWTEIYARNLTAGERRRVMEALESQARKLSLWREDIWGPVLEDRGSQITFSTLSQEAPLEEKRAWDPDGRKKEALRATGVVLLPELKMRSGGSTSVDATYKGINKAYGIGELSSRTGITVSDILFVGGRLDGGGDDYLVLRLGTDAYPVDGWQDTARFVEEYAATHTPGGADMPGEAEPQSS